MSAIFADRLCIRKDMALLEVNTSMFRHYIFVHAIAMQSSISQANGTTHRINGDLKRVKLLEMLGEGTVPRLNARIHMLNKEQQAVKDVLQGLAVRMEVSHCLNPFLRRHCCECRDCDIGSMRVKMLAWRCCR